MTYTPEQIQDFKNIIITGISNGRSLLSMQNDTTLNLPSRPTIYTWLNANHENYDETFFNNYTRAREDSGDWYADKVDATVDLMLEGTITPEQARVAIDGYKWGAGVNKPKKYGKTLDLTSGGDKIQSAPSAIRIDIVKPNED